ncbi:hypothetical protein B296_00020897 [Ensete ventricosum]|uniref:Uncharacterized protein n=1 Tax=Ensete ventricosum TaxID=4639 RepID=A0A426ZS88_ENSVE|nr:hypothetical protein B296_00020897 [Ensete ventricosum]
MTRLPTGGTVTRGPAQAYHSSGFIVFLSPATTITTNRQPPSPPSTVKAEKASWKPHSPSQGFGAAAPLVAAFIFQTPSSTPPTVSGAHSRAGGGGELSMSTRSGGGRPIARSPRIELRRFEGRGPGFRRLCPVIRRPGGGDRGGVDPCAGNGTARVSAL